METVDLKKLAALEEKISRIATEFGLTFPPIDFEVIPSQKMIEIMAYHFPINFSHWSFGREFEAERTKYDHGFSVPYEVVFDGSEARAFLMRTNPLPVQALVIAHVFAHADFFFNNIHFGKARKDMLSASALAAERIRHYEEEYGLDAVEKLLDAALAIQQNVDNDYFMAEESEEEKLARISGKKESSGPRLFDPFDGLTGKKPASPPSKQELKRKIPLEPEKDLLLFIANYSPKPLEDWEKDVLDIVRQQGQYFWPVMRTKIMNEGWAAYWHKKIMERLFAEKVLNSEDHGIYNLSNARVLSMSRRMLNPYLVGSEIWKDIKDRWDKGRFGKEWQECNDPIALKNWDKKSGLGTGQIFKLRKSYSDRMFIEQFLTDELIDDLDLYIYEPVMDGDEIVWVIKEKNPAIIRMMLVRQLTDFGRPLIMVEDGNYSGNRELYLKHYYEGMELEPEYREKTLDLVQFMWGKPVCMETVENGKRVLFKRTKKDSSKAFI